MIILGVQLILLAFAFLMIYILYLHWKKKQLSNRMFLFWLVVWSVFIIITVFPKIIEPLIRDLFIVRVMDLGMILAFMILSYFTVESNIKINNLEKMIEKIVRNKAMRENEK